MISTPQIDQRPERHTLGIRVQTPMRGMSKVISKILVELDRWLKANGVTPSGPPFVRYYVIDMTGEMDIEAGYPVAGPLAGDGRVRQSTLPAGRYASLVYSGSGLAGNKALLVWAHENGLRWDRWQDPKGDAFRCRYESYLTDPKTEPRKTKWNIEVAIKLA